MNLTAIHLHLIGIITSVYFSASVEKFCLSHPIFIVCNWLEKIKFIHSVTSKLTGCTHITSSINCKTENVIYIWKRTKCGHNFNINKTTNTLNNMGTTVYCGMTKRKFSDRMSEHRDKVQWKLKNFVENILIQLVTHSTIFKVQLYNMLKVKIHFYFESKRISSYLVV